MLQMVSLCLMCIFVIRFDRIDSHPRLKILVSFKSGKILKMKNDEGTIYFETKFTTGTEPPYPHSNIHEIFVFIF